MLKKDITYTDFNGNERTESFYFNLTKAEIAEMELRTEGGISAHMQRIVSAQNGNQIMDEFKRIIFGAYGVKSDDGRRFIKSEEISKEFEQTEAYSVLFMELVTDADAGAAFVNGLIPADVADAAAAEMAKQGINVPQRPTPQDHLPAQMQTQQAPPVQTLPQQFQTNQAPQQMPPQSPYYGEVPPQPYQQ